MPTASGALPAPLPAAGWTPALVDARFALSEAMIRGGAGGESLYISEIAPGAAQAASIRSVPFTDVASVVRGIHVRDAAARYHPAPGGTGGVLTITRGNGGGQSTTAFAISKLSRRLAVLMEVHLTGAGPAEALGATEDLRRRVAKSLAPALPGPLLERWIPLAMWGAAALATAGGIAVSFSPSRSSIWTVFAGFGAFLLVTLAALAAGTRVAAGGSSAPTLGDRLLTLWSHPWILSGPAAAAPIPLATLALLLRTSHEEPLLAVLYWGTIVLGLAVIALGSNHRLVRQLLRRRDAGPAPAGEDWVTTRTVPDGFPAVPEGAVIGVYSERSGLASAVLVRPTRQRDPEWVRWNQATRSWAGPAGTVEARAHQVWDERVETIVEVMLGDRVLVVESVADVERTWGLVRRLTDHLQEQPGAPAPATGPRGFLTYSLAPVWAQYFLAAYLWIGALAFRGNALPQLRPYVIVCAIALVGVPLYLLAGNLLAARRPELYALTGPHLLRRARRGRLHTALAALPLMLPIIAFASTTVGEGLLPLILWGALGAWIAAAATVPAVARTHGPGGAYQAGASRSPSGVGR